MGVVLDSSVLIAYERERLDIQEHMVGREDEPFFLSVISASELLHGVHRASKAQVQARRSAWVEAILERFPILPIDVAVARAHAQLWASLKSAGDMIGTHDSWIAATCLSHGLALATANEREFDRVPGLRVLRWRSS